jgi:hypothetical protein
MKEKQAVRQVLVQAEAAAKAGDLKQVSKLLKQAHSIRAKAGLPKISDINLSFTYF